MDTSYFSENLIRTYQTTRWYISENSTDLYGDGEINTLNIYPEDEASTFFRNVVDTRRHIPDRGAILKSNRSAIFFEVMNTAPMPLRPVEGSRSRRQNQFW
jgi:hypothetical protein